MSAPSTAGGPPVTSKAQLVEYLEAGCKPRASWRVGTEHEKFVFRRSDKSRPGYEGPDGIRALLQAMTRFDWQPVYEGEHIAALRHDEHGSITFEPGGQLELSGNPLESLHDTCSEVTCHLHQTREVGAELGVGLIGMGFDPKWKREEVPWMPRERHLIMKRYMPKKGSLGLDMMIRTCTVQVNLDFESEADMVRKMRVSLALQPIATALFANSPFTEGKPNGFMSYRSHVWTDTDPDRCGPLPWVFDDGFGFERYVDYALGVPMYFVYRDRYIDVSGASFADFLDGKLDALPGERPTLVDWDNHLTTLFPDVRLKRYIEQRGADGGPWRRLCALPALWTGLLYDESSLAAAEELIAGWTAADREELQRSVPRLGLKAPMAVVEGGTLAVAARVLAIARAGLDARDKHDSKGRSESHFLDILDEIVDRGDSPAAWELAQLRDEWDGDIDRLYDELAY